MNKVREIESSIRKEFRDGVIDLKEVLFGEDTKGIRESLERTGKKIDDDVFLGIWIMLEARERMT